MTALATAIVTTGVTLTAKTKVSDELPTRYRPHAVAPVAPLLRPKRSRAQRSSPTLKAVAAACEPQPRRTNGLPNAPEVSRPTTDNAICRKKYSGIPATST